MQVPSSDRLQFHFMTADDAELFLHLDSDPEVMRYINGGKVSTRESISSWYIPRLEKYADQAKGWGMWGASEKETGDFLGWILVRPMGFFGDNRDDEDIELGWRFLRAAWGKGYGTEAARAVMQSLEANGYSKFTAYAMKENSGSINIMKKLGMSFLREAPDPEDESLMLVYYSRTAS